MPRAMIARIDEALPPASYNFILVELAFRDEADVPGLLRYKLESVLPRGLEGLTYFFRRIGRTRRFLVTLVKEPAPLSFSPERTRLPFELRLPGKEDREIEWEAGSVSFLTRYDKGCLTAVESRAGVADRSDPDMSRRFVRREAPRRGPAIQQSVGRGELVWKISALALAFGLAAQVAILVFGSLSSRETKLASLEEQIAILSRNAPTEGSPMAGSASLGLQSRADDVFQSVSSKWKLGFYLTKWSLKGSHLRLEGWGPNALSLLSSLRGDPYLAALELASRKDSEGYELFAFEGEVADD